MVSITIRDQKLADEQSSPYTVLISTDATAYSAYATIEEFMQEWHDTLSEMRLNANNFVGQRALSITSDWTAQTVYVYSNELKAMQGKARDCKLLSNGSIKPGAILVDKANKQTTFFRLNPNDKNY